VPTKLLLPSLILLLALTGAVAAQDGHAPTAKPGPPQKNQQAPGAAQTPQIAPPAENRIVAVVNDDVITSEDLQDRILLVLRTSGIPDTTENRQRMSARVLRTLIDEKMQMQESKHLNVSVSKEEIDQALARIEQQNNMAKGSLDAFLEKSSIPRSTLIGELTAGIAWGKLVQNRLSQEVTISDSDVADTLARMKENADTPQSQISQIFLAIDNPGQDDEVRRLADKLEEQLHAGANFSAIAQQFSQSPTAAVGGDLGWITPSEINPTLAQAIKDMKPGDISPPIRSGGGYYILLLADRRLPGHASADQTQISVVEAGAGLAPNAPPEYRARLETILGQLGRAGQTCEAFTAAAHKLNLPFVKEAPNIKASSLTLAVRRIVLGMTPGQVSRPFPVEGGFGVVMLCDRKDPATVVMPTREQITESLGRERLDILARRYMRDLRRSAYLDIRG
jgi:peptidyl-prolyl cis-trans isomerase SurA